MLAGHLKGNTQGPAFHGTRVFLLDKKQIRHYDEHCFCKIVIEFFLVEKIELQTGIKVLASYTAHSHLQISLKNLMRSVLDK